MCRLLPLLLVLSPAAVAAGEPPAGSDRVTLWEGGTGGYAAYRIPALERSPGGTLLAFCEGRKNGGSDQGDIDLLLRRSPDGGRTWTPSVVLHEEGGDAPVTIGNPCPIADPAAGVVHLLFTRNNERLFHTASDDDGQAWAPPREITAALAGFDYPTVRVGTGPGHGLRLSDDHAAAGRLVAPVWLSDRSLERRGEDDAAERYVSACLLSDDGGVTWRAGGVVPPTLRRLNEATVCELPGGRLLMNSRTHGLGSRALSLSEDGGETWSAPALVTQLPDATCQGSGRHAGDGLLWFANVPTRPAAGASAGERRGLTLSRSEDAGRTWAPARVVEPGRSAYSDLAFADPADPTAGLLLLFECGDRTYRDRIDFARPAVPAADAAEE